jgi:hypothetical protein
VCFQHVGQLAHVHRHHTLIVQPFNEVTHQRVLCVGTTLRPLSVQPSNPL